MTDEGGQDRGGGGSPIDFTAIERLLEWGGPALQQKMIDLFLENGPERIQSVRSGIESGDFGTAERAAHSLKSSAGNLGANRLQELARQMEEALEAGNGARAGELVPEMEEHLTQTLHALRAFKEGT